MIYTLTLNPAMDITISTKKIDRKKANKTTLRSVSAGGKGFNTSRALDCMGGENIAVAFMGGFFKQNMENLLNEEGLRHYVVPVQGNTRANIKLVEEETETMVELNSEGPSITHREIDCLFNYLKKINKRKRPEYFVLSGSLPKDTDIKMYSHLINFLKSEGIKVLLDAAGEPLYHGILASPDIVKINQSELEEACNRHFRKSPEEVVSDLLSRGIKTIMITNGPHEIKYYDIFYSYKITPPDTKGPYKTGSGDSVNAGLVFALTHNYPVEEMLKYSIACGNANILTETPGKIDMADVCRLMGEVKIEKLL